MTTLECSKDRPWGIHQFLRLDVACPRCGWADGEDRVLPFPVPYTEASWSEPPEALAA